MSNIAFLFYLLSIDGTFSDGLGRLVNDSPMRHANCQVKKIFHGNRVHLCLFAATEITSGVELRFDYGLKDLPWRSNEGTLYIYTMK